MEAMKNFYKTVDSILFVTRVPIPWYHIVLSHLAGYKERNSETKCASSFRVYEVKL